MEVTSKEVKRLKVSLSGRKSVVEENKEKAEKKKNLDSGISVNKSFCFL